MLVWKIPREAPRHVSFRQHCSHSAQAWICESRAERSATSARQAYSRRSRRWLEFSMCKNLFAKSHDQTNKWPEHHFLLRLGIRNLCFDLHKSDLICDPTKFISSEFTWESRWRNGNCSSFFKFKETPFWFYFLFQLMIQRIPFKQHNTKNYLTKQVPRSNARCNMRCTYTAGIYTHRCLFEEYHVKRLGTSLHGNTSQSAQAWIRESRAERSATSARQAFSSSSSRRWLEFSVSKNLFANHTTKQTNDPSTISASD